MSYPLPSVGVVQVMPGSSVVEGMLVDWVRTRPTPEPRLPVSWLSAEERAEELQRLQANRARDAAREAELILSLAADRPEELDPPPGSPGARRGSWPPDGELPGVSDSFPAELSVVLNCGRGTAVWGGRGGRGGGGAAGLVVECPAPAHLYRAEARGAGRAAGAGAVRRAAVRRSGAGSAGG